MCFFLFTCYRDEVIIIIVVVVIIIIISSISIILW